MRLTEVLDSAFVRAPSPPRRLGSQLLAHVRIPLHRDGYALALNSAFTAATGLLYWIVAAKSYTTHAVGLNSALISSMMFLAGVASLNLPNILVRFLPESGVRTRRRVAWSYVVAAAVALCAAAIFVAGVGAFAPRLRFLRSDHGLQAWFVLSTLAWCLFVLQDSVLIALGRAILVPVENAVFSLLKLALLAALAALVPLYGIFVSWTIAMLVSVIGVNLVIFVRLMRPAARRVDREIASIRDRAFARYFAADYVCSIAWLSTTNLMPVVVTAAAGATTNAYWALAYAVALPLYAFAQNIGTSLILHGTNDRAALASLTRKAAVQGLRLLVPVVALLLVLAPDLLSLFGASYAHRSATLLRLLALGALPNFVLSLAVSVARVQRRLRRAMIALCTEAILALGLAVPLLHAFGIAGVGIAWVGAQCLVAAGLLITWRSALKEGHEVEPSLGAEPDPPVTPDSELPTTDDAVEPRDAVELHPLLRRLFDDLGRRRLRWTLLRVPSNPAAPTGDVDLLVAPADAQALVSAAAKLGFVALPGWESSPDLILVCYDRPSDSWLLLDVSTAVSFRSPRSWQISGAAEYVLRRRRWVGGVVVPAAADAFWLLLLHCLLDKGVVAPHHRTRLRSLVPAAIESPPGPLACATARAGLTSGTFVEAVQVDDWQRLAELGRTLATELKRRRPLPERLRLLIREAARLAHKPSLLRRRRGVNIALLGPNGVGKSTAAAGLQRSFPFDSRVVYMGVWKEAMKPRSRAMTVVEILGRPLRIWSGYLTAQYHQLRGRLVVFDRYVYEALLPARPPLLTIKRLYFGFLARALPAPSAVIVLDAPGHVAYARKQENPPDELESERRIYAGLVGHGQPAELVNAEAGADTVRAEITTVVWRELAARWSGAHPTR